jgi:hypothetical protein
MAHQERAFPRYACDAVVTVHHARGTAGGNTTNLSRGGLCALVSETIGVGATVDVEIALVFDEETTSEPLRLPARVVWSTPLDDKHQLGVSFLSLTADQTKYLDLFLRYLATPRTHPASHPDDLFGGTGRRRLKPRG